jgi:hypothetical protein
LKNILEKEITVKSLDNALILENNYNDKNFRKKIET